MAIVNSIFDSRQSSIYLVEGETFIYITNDKPLEFMN